MKLLSFGEIWWWIAREDLHQDEQSNIGVSPVRRVRGQSSDVRTLHGSAFQHKVQSTIQLRVVCEQCKRHSECIPFSCCTRFTYPERRKLTWLWSMVIYQDGLTIHIQSPILAVTTWHDPTEIKPTTSWSHFCDTNHYATTKPVWRYHYDNVFSDKWQYKWLWRQNKHNAAVVEKNKNSSELRVYRWLAKTRCWTYCQSH